MRRFRDLPIRHKLLLTTLASSAAALALASGGFLAWDIAQFRIEIAEDVDAQARIVADNSAAPLTFRDDQAAGETLAVLRLRPRIDMACLYAAAGPAVRHLLPRSDDRLSGGAAAPIDVRAGHARRPYRRSAWGRTAWACCTSVAT